MKINEILQNENIILDVAVKTKDAIIRQLTDLLYMSGRIKDKKIFLKDVYIRESLGFTGVGKGIAIPHGISDTVKEVSVAIARTRNAVVWDTLDEIKQEDRKIRLIVLFAVPSGDVYEAERRHIEALKLVMEKLAVQTTLQRLLKAGDKEEILNIFSEEIS